RGVLPRLPDGLPALRRYLRQRTRGRAALRSHVEKSQCLRSCSARGSRHSSVIHESCAILESAGANRLFRFVTAPSRPRLLGAHGRPARAGLDDRLVNESVLSRKVEFAGQALADVGHRIIRLWRADGCVRIASIALRLATSPLLEYGRLVFFVRELDDDRDWPKAPVSHGLEIRQAHVSEIPKLISAGRADPTLAALRFRRGDQCVVVVDRD